MHLLLLAKDYKDRKKKKNIKRFESCMSECNADGPASFASNVAAKLLKPALGSTLLCLFDRFFLFFFTLEPDQSTWLLMLLAGNDE